MTRSKAGPDSLPYSVAEFNSFPDEALRALVVGVDRRSGTFGGVSITLLLSGVTVSGILASSDEFYRAVTEWPGFPDDLVAASIQRPDPAADDHLAEVFSEPDYIHLRSAVLYLPAGEQGMPSGTIWRGRLTQVSAWFLGRPEPLRS
jgi:hypothetical protein